MYHEGFNKQKRAAAALGVSVMMLALWTSGASAAPDPLKCKRTIAKETAKFESKKIKNIQKCHDHVLKGDIAGPCPDTDTATSNSEAETKMRDKIKKACIDEAVNLADIGFDDLVNKCDAGSTQAGKVCDPAAGGTCQQEAGTPCDPTKVGCEPGSTSCPDCPAGKVCIRNGCPAACLVGPRTGSQCEQDLDCASCGAGTPTPGAICTTGANQCGQVCAAGACGCVVPAGGCGFSTAGCVPTNSCPTVENDGLPNGSCDSALADPATTSLSECLVCNSEGAVDQLIALDSGGLNDPGTDSDLVKCERAIVKEAVKFYRAKRKALQKCEDAIFKGKFGGPCPDAKALDKINKATAKVLDKIPSKCTGLSTAATGGPFFCPGFVVPGGSSCGNTIATVADLAECVQCIAEYKADILTRATAPANGALPPEANPKCGNGKIDVGETCDDGNTLSGDACPSDCTIGPCAGGGSPVVGTVSFSSPVALSSLQLTLEYPDQQLRIVGTGPGVAGQITPLGEFDSVTPNDLDYILKILLIDTDLVGEPGPGAFTVNFQTCAGAVPPFVFNCHVDAAIDLSAQTVPGVSCSASVP